MSFAERNGFVQEKSIQVDSMDRNLRNRLFNIVHGFSENSPFINEELKFVVDRLGWKVEVTSQRNWKIVENIHLPT